MELQNTEAPGASPLTQLKEKDMSYGRLTKEVQKNLTAVTDNAVQYEWFTDWIPCTGMDYARVVLRIRALQGDFNARPAYQTAITRPSKPDAAAGSGTVRTSVGDYYEVIDLTSVTNSKFYIRLGVEYTLTAEGTDGSADVSVQVSYQNRGTSRGSFYKSLLAPSSSLVLTEPITGWMPAIEVSKANVVCCATDADSDGRIGDSGVLNASPVVGS
jgi:hypothetical protein